ncbi:GlxA family transcriptional regulator [Thalassotalea montiporae]
MITVTILAFDYVLASALTGINDLFNLAGVSWNKYHQLPVDKRFQVRIASWQKKPIYTMNDVIISPHCAISDTIESDIFLVPSIAGDIDKTLAQNPELIAFLRHLKGSDAIIGSNSTGSFFLAEAGLLDGKSATTHWASAEQFSQCYPNVSLNSEQHITHDGNILCDSGGMAWFDLGLYLIELFCEHETAQGTARSFVLETGRTAQLTYSPLIAKKYHNDKTVKAVQEWLESHYSQTIAISEVSQQFGVSNRTLIRRFKEAAKITPSEYLQAIRIDAASKLLVQSNQHIDEITHAVGYSDISSFTKLFKRKTGLSPSNYRARYKANLL